MSGLQESAGECYIIVCANLFPSFHSRVKGVRFGASLFVSSSQHESFFLASSFSVSSSPPPLSFSLPLVTHTRAHTHASSQDLPSSQRLCLHANDRSCTLRFVTRFTFCCVGQCVCDNASYALRMHRTARNGAVAREQETQVERNFKCNTIPLSRNSDSISGLDVPFNCLF